MERVSENAGKHASALHRGEEKFVRAFETGGTLPITERAAITVGVAAQFIGISRSRIYELLADGTLDGKVVSGRRVVLVPSLLRFLGQSPSTTKSVQAA